ncbi:MAG: hypothetical protein U5M53_01995 [Rhodoferax sp.]|nr:hypothetical protein [Rhodoferax sp.]
MDLLTKIVLAKGKASLSCAKVFWASYLLNAINSIKAEKLYLHVLETKPLDWAKLKHSLCAAGAQEYEKAGMKFLLHYHKKRPKPTRRPTRSRSSTCLLRFWNSER